MSQVFNSIDLRRKIFNFKSSSLKQEAKKNYDSVLEELEEHLTNYYETREDQEWGEIELNTIRNLTRNEYYNLMIQELAKEKYFSMEYWLIDWIVEGRFEYMA